MSAPAPAPTPKASPVASGPVTNIPAAKPVGRASNDPRDKPAENRVYEIITVDGTKPELPPAVEIKPTRAPAPRAKNDPRGA